MPDSYQNYYDWKAGNLQYQPVVYEDNSFKHFTPSERQELWDSGLRPVNEAWEKAYPTEDQQRVNFIGVGSVRDVRKSGNTKSRGEWSDDDHKVEQKADRFEFEGGPENKPLPWEDKSLKPADRYTEAIQWFRDNPDKTDRYSKPEIIHGTAKRLPMTFGVLDFIELGHEKAAMDRMYEGTASPTDYFKLARTVARSEQEEQDPFGVQALRQLSYLPGFAADIAATGGISAFGKVAGGKAVGKLAKHLGRKKFQEFIGKSAVKKAAGAGLEVATFTGVTQAGRTVGEAIPTRDIEFDPETETGFAKTEKDSWFNTLPKSIANQSLEYTVERFTGPLLGKAVGRARTALRPASKANIDAIPDDLMNLMKKRVVTAWKIQNPGRASLAGKIGYNGMVTEMGEEQLTEALQGINEAFFSALPGYEREAAPQIESKFGLAGDIAQEVGYQTGLTDETAAQAADRRGQMGKQFLTQGIGVGLMGGAMRGISGPSRADVAGLKDPILSLAGKGLEPQRQKMVDKYKQDVADLIESGNVSREAFKGVTLPDAIIDEEGKVQQEPTTLYDHFIRREQREGFIAEATQMNEAILQQDRVEAIEERAEREREAQAEEDQPAGVIGPDGQIYRKGTKIYDDFMAERKFLELEQQQAPAAVEEQQEVPIPGTPESAEAILQGEEAVETPDLDRQANIMETIDYGVESLQEMDDAGDDREMPAVTNIEQDNKNVDTVSQITLADVRKLVPGRKVNETEYGFDVFFEGGRVPVYMTQNIDLTDRQIEKIYGNYADSKSRRFTHWDTDKSGKVRSFTEAFPTAESYAQHLRTQGVPGTVDAATAAQRGELGWDILATIRINDTDWSRANRDQMKVLRHELVHVAHLSGMWNKTELDSLIKQYSAPNRSAAQQSEDLATNMELWQKPGMMERFTDWINRLMNKITGGKVELKASAVVNLLHQEKFWGRQTQDFSEFMASQGQQRQQDVSEQMLGIAEVPTEVTYSDGDGYLQPTPKIINREANKVHRFDIETERFFSELWDEYLPDRAAEVSAIETDLETADVGIAHVFNVVRDIIFKNDDIKSWHKKDIEMLVNAVGADMANEFNDFLLPVHLTDTGLVQKLTPDEKTELDLIGKAMSDQTALVDGYKQFPKTKDAIEFARLRDKPTTPDITLGMAEGELDVHGREQPKPGLAKPWLSPEARAAQDEADRLRMTQVISRETVRLEINRRRGGTPQQRKAADDAALERWRNNPTNFDVFEHEHMIRWAEELSFSKNPADYDLALEIMLMRREAVAEQARSLAYGKDPYRNNPILRRHSSLMDAIFTTDRNKLALFAKRKSKIPREAKAGQKAYNKEEKRIAKVRKYVEKLGYEFTPEGLRKLARNRKDAYKVAQYAVRSTWSYGTWANNLFSEYTYGSMLSGLNTQVVNLLSNTTWGVAMEFEQFGAAVFNSMLGKFKNSEDITLEDYRNAWKRGGVKQKPEEMAAILRIAVKNGWTRWITEQAILEEQVGAEEKIKMERNVPAIPGVLGKGFRMIHGFGPMAAVDQFYKTLFTHMDVGVHAFSLARRQVERFNRNNPKRKPMTQEDINRLAEEMIEDKTSQAWHDALQQAEQKMFQDEGGEISKKVLGAAKTIRGIPIIGAGFQHLVAPFVRTPVRLMGNALIRLPGFGSIVTTGKMISNYKAGKHVLDGVSREIVGQIAVGMLASAIAMGVSEDEEETMFTGAKGSLGKQSRSFRYHEGVAPSQGVKLFGQWVQYDRFDPFAVQIAAIVDGVYALKAGKGIGGAIKDVGLSTAASIQEKSFTRSLGDLMKAVEDDEENGQRWIASALTRFYPNLYQQISRAKRPTIGEKRGETVMEEFKKRAELAPSEDIHDPWGRKAKSAGWSPIKHKTADAFVGDRVFMNWNRLNPDAKEPKYPTRPSRDYRREGVDRRMDDKTYAEYARIAGTLSRNVVERMVSPEMGRNPSDRIMAMVESSLSRGRVRVKDHLHKTGSLEGFNIDREEQLLQNALYASMVGALRKKRPVKYGQPNEEYQEELDKWQRDRDAAMEYVEWYRQQSNTRIRQ